MPQSLGTETSKGVLWTGFGRYTNQVLRIAVSAVLSRLLTPKDFGIVAMVLVFSGFLSVFSDAGLASSVIQFREFKKRELSTFFWLGLFIGVLLSVGFAAAAPYIANFYSLPPLRAVAAVIGWGFLLSAIEAVPAGLLQRQMRFKAIALIQATSAFAASIFAIVMALRGAGYWALVVQLLLSKALISVLLFVIASWYPRFKFDTVIVKRIFGYSGNLTLFNTINYWARNLDNLLIGRFLGSNALGYYNRAYTLMLLPLSMLTSVIGTVLHPALSSIQNDVPRMYRAYLKVLKFIATLCFPLMVVLGLMAPEFVHTLWGGQWDASVPVFQILCIVGAIQSVVSTTGDVFKACNRTDLLFKVGGVGVAILCAGIVIGLPWGITGVAIGYSVAYVIIVIPIMYIVLSRLFGGALRDLFHVLRNPLLIAGGVGVIVSLWNILVRGMLIPPLHFIFGSALALLVYFSLLYLMDRAFLKGVYSLTPIAFRSRLRWILRLERRIS